MISPILLIDHPNGLILRAAALLFAADKELARSVCSFKAYRRDGEQGILQLRRAAYVLGAGGLQRLWPDPLATALHAGFRCFSGGGRNIAACSHGEGCAGREGHLQHQVQLPAS